MDQVAIIYDFVGSEQWISLLEAKDNSPTFNIQNIVSYFLEKT